MAQPSKDEIVTAWRALAGAENDSGWRSISLAVNGPCRLHAARYFPGNAEALLLSFDTLKLPASSQLPQAKGFKVERLANPDPAADGRRLGLIRQPQGSLELFGHMVTDIVTTIINESSKDEQRFFNLFLGRIRAWQKFMMEGHEGLSAEAELGLVGELQCMELIAEAGVALHVVLEGWVGPMDGLQDYELGDGSIEVKSTLAREGFIAEIMSLEQLDDSQRQPLFVCGCRFDLGPSGMNLPRRVAGLRERFSEDLAMLALFENKLLHAGYFDLHAPKYTREFLLIDSYFRLVDEKFPRLIPGTVPVGIRSAKYQVNLEFGACESVPVETVIARLGIFKDGIS